MLPAVALGQDRTRLAGLDAMVQAKLAAYDRKTADGTGKRRELELLIIPDRARPAETDHIRMAATRMRACSGPGRWAVAIGGALRCGHAELPGCVGWQADAGGRITGTCHSSWHEPLCVDPAAAPEPVRRHRRPAWMRPDALIPGPVPAEVVLIRTEQVAAAIGSVRAYLNGFEFTLHTRQHSEDETRGRVRLIPSPGTGTSEGCRRRRCAAAGRDVCRWPPRGDDRRAPAVL